MTAREDLCCSFASSAHGGSIPRFAPWRRSSSSVNLPGIGLVTYRRVFIPDLLSNDSTLARAIAALAVGCIGELTGKGRPAFA